jgi:hypothetical protein
MAWGIGRRAWGQGRRYAWRRGDLEAWRRGVEMRGDLELFTAGDQLL